MVFMLFLMKINLKSYLVFKSVAILNAAILKRVLFLVFMLFLMKINLKSYLVFKSVAILNAAILKDDERGCILV
ncbi:hypothetical protein HPCPY1313_1181 [Helicobacter pylori CPY1313]|nr:hypothetical protein HPCPY1313_1181 [Helicobacter pylori CPY1313]